MGIETGDLHLLVQDLALSLGLQPELESIVLPHGFEHGVFSGVSGPQSFQVNGLGSRQIVPAFVFSFDLFAACAWVPALFLLEFFVLVKEQILKRVRLV